MKKIKFTGLGIGLSIFLGGIGGYNLGNYELTKKRVIDKSIKGETINLKINEPSYRVLGSSVVDFLRGDFGGRLAEERFKAGEFDDTIIKHRPDYHNNS